MTIATSPLGKVPWIYAGPYDDEVNRDLKWYSSWANHYFSQGGVGNILGVMQIIPMALLLCPFVNIVTYLALSVFYQGKEKDLFKSALNEGNPTAAYIMTERGADAIQKNNSGKTLLDIYADKGEKAKGFSTQDLNIIETLFEKGISADFKHKGFELLLETALTQNRHKLAVFLLQQKVQPKTPWSSYRQKPTVEVLSLPDWAKKSFTIIGNNLCKTATTETLEKFSRKGNPLYQLIRIFGQSMRSCPILLGESEVERKSLMTALAREILQDKVPSNLKQNSIIEIDLSHGDEKTTMKDLKSLLNSYTDLLEKDPQLIFYFHNFEIFEKATTGHPEIKRVLIDLATKGRVVFSMTPALYKRHFAQNHLIQSRFTTVDVSKPTEKEAIPLLHSMKAELEAQHEVTYTSFAIQAAIQMTRYIPNSTIPQTSYEILDAAAILFKEQETKGSIATQEAERKKQDLLFDRDVYRLKNGKASKKRLERIDEELNEIEETLKKLKNQDAIELQAKTFYHELKAEKAYLESLDSSLSAMTKPLLAELDKDLKALEETIKDSNIKFEVDRELVAAVVSTRSGIPLDRVRGADAEKLRKLDEALGEQVIGQSKAVHAIAEALKAARLGLRDESKPRGVFLCAGTSGTGKTEMAKAIARQIFGDERNMTRLDMSEYQAKENKSRLIGAPPGYVGFDKGGQLTEALKENPYQVILIDEVEKASPDVLTAFLQVFSDGRLTDGQGNVVDCSQAVFLMTTNLGSRIIAASHETYSLWNPLNWHYRYKLLTYGRPSEEAIIRQALKNSEHFSPELIGRLKIVTFDPITSNQDLEKIARKVLKKQQEQIWQTQGIELKWSDKVVTELARNSSSIEYGVRPLIDKIEKNVLAHLSDEILYDRIHEGDTVQIDYDETRNALTFTPISA
ncbi:AAA family ATPase [Simkania negevensis]|uniref:ATP-dependent chaperone protein ClpB n=1 Tax=Simkania negevensis (strain ATCC VR-1471 / DSM 27360 / Z) TaxID=331113 RepID=F8L9V1_SIMNZ|nr:AAA family ATPase [Simkania negevensis]CCB89654.1 ATP-dependent chaperone protein ClpB [Simkania negevensis Z]